MFERDLVFLHAPSVYDFRKHAIMFGPISDVIPSSPVFEMYPVGITSIAHYLEKHGYNVQIINLAYRMLRDPNYDVEKVISRIRTRAFAIDLHWLPHAHGSIEIARIVKKHHPNLPVIFGGLSASYYDRELMTYPEVDYVVRGDSTEEPMRQLMDYLRRGKGRLEDIPNLTWKRDGNAIVNPLTNVPDSLDYASVPGYSYVVSSVFKYANLYNAVPFAEWLSYPMTMLLTARGCSFNCAICGGSRDSYRMVCNRKKPAFRSPKVLMQDIKTIRSFGKAPIFVVHDLRMGGQEFVNEFFGLLGEMNPDNEFVFELFSPASDEYFSQIENSVRKWSLEISVESHLERTRALTGKFSCPNSEFEETIRAALRHGCRKVDVFFMIGLPKQTYEDAVGTVDYIDHLLDVTGNDSRVVPFIAPLAPFLDPGSPAFENPEKYGYKKFCHTLESHRRALTEPSWKYTLSYETDCMTRDDIVRATYEAARRLNDLKLERKIIDERTHASVKERLERSQSVVERIDRIRMLPDEQEKAARIRELAEEIDFGWHSICGKDELKWPARRKFAGLVSLVHLGAKLLVREILAFGRRVTMNRNVGRVRNGGVRNV